MRFFIWFSLSLIAAFGIYACSLRNNIEPPPCKVYESVLMGRWWVASSPGYKGKFAKVYFTADKEVRDAASSDTIIFTLQNCNKLQLSNITHPSDEAWEIEYLKDAEMKVKTSGNEEVVFKPEK